MNVICKNVQLLLFVIQLLAYHGSRGFDLNNAEEVSKFIQDLIEEFKKDPTNERFHNVIHPPPSPVDKTQAEFLMPKVLLWSPSEQYNCPVNCPVHNKPLRPCQWTSDLSGKKGGQRPRLIHDLFGNILLVQRIYTCTLGRMTHRLIATSPALMNTLPSWLQMALPVRLFQRSGMSKKLLQYVKSSVTQGVNFLKICESIASLNHGEHTALGLAYNEARNDSSVSREPYDFDDFYTNDIFSYPSNDHVMNVFLEQFELDKPAYISEMRKVTGTAIACDHTFRVSNNMGTDTEGEGGKFLKDFSNLFIVLNEHGNIFNWRLTKGTAFNEIDDLLIDLRDRLLIEKHPIETVCIEDCCENRQKYQSVFPSADVKLNIFHALQTVMRSLPKNHVLNSQFSKEFLLIFRENGDDGDQRLRSTPSEYQIEENLDGLLRKWTSMRGTCLTQESLLKIDSLRVHIRRGCLSRIPPGFATQHLEQLHKILNKSLFSGAPRISIELAVALLSVIFFCHSKRAASDRKHRCNSMIQCVSPIRRYSKTSADPPTKKWFPFKTQEDPTATTVSESTETNAAAESISAPHTIDDACSEMVSESILKAALGSYELLKKFSEYNCSKSLNADELLLLTNIPAGLTMYHVDNVEYEEDGRDPTVGEHVQSLSRNLEGFSLTTDAVSKDGDCAFRSLARMLSSICDPEQPEILSHLTSIGLCKSEDDDTITMRHLFVEEILKCDDELLPFFPNQDREAFAKRAQEFRRQGIFDTAIGDLVMRVCAQFLRVPIMVVTSLNSLPCVPFLSSNPLSSKPIFVAYHYYGAGHYDATKPLALGEESAEFDEQQSSESTKINEAENNGCYCGRRLKSRDKLSCVKGGKSRGCPCVMRGQFCNRDVCKCRFCANVDKNAPKKELGPCRCGEAKRSKNAKTVSCADVKGQMRTKCPCFTAGLGCKGCSCYNCQNGFGINSPLPKDNQNGRKRKRSMMLPTPPSLQRRRGIGYLPESNVETISEGWNQLESCVLHMAESYILSSLSTPTKENLCFLYNLVIESAFAKGKALTLKTKSSEQVSEKMEDKNRRMEALWRLASGQSESS